VKMHAKPFPRNSNFVELGTSAGNDHEVSSVVELN
jgi:hypothetical protein